VSGELFRKKFPVGPSKTELVTLSAVLFLVVSQGSLFMEKALRQPLPKPAPTINFI
jgi:hypothetical protein